MNSDGSASIYPRMPLEFVTHDERRLLLAVAVSLALHALALTVFPSLRPQVAREPELLQVDLVPLPAPPAEPISLPSPPEALLEPKVETPKEPEPIVKPKLRLEKKVKPVKKQEPPEVETIPEPAPAAEPAPPPPVIATPPPEAIEPPSFTVPQAQPVPSPRVAEPPPTEVIDGYGDALSRLISRYQRYPRLAQMRGWEGIVQVAIDIGAQGKISGMKISQSSGFEVLDKQALEMINAAQPFPPAPPSLQGKRFVVNVPIVFRLKN